MQKIDNFFRALKNLEEINDYHEPYGTVEMTGMVALFEICFEQSWKAIKELLESEGFPEGKTGSPKMILKTAYSAGIISDEDLWLAALESRNHVAHAYNEQVAREIIGDTKSRYINMFRDLRTELEKKRV